MFNIIGSTIVIIFLLLVLGISIVDEIPKLLCKIGLHKYKLVDSKYGGLYKKYKCFKCNKIKYK